MQAFEGRLLNALNEAGLGERYVCEGSGAMFVARVVEPDPASSTYRLPAAQAALLTDSESAHPILES